MAAIIAVMGAALLIADRMARHLADLGGLSLKNILIIGFSQALAIFPGVSRSGSTITAGLGLGLKREAAAKFSFLLSAPIIAGAGLKSLYEIYSGLKTGAIAQNDLLLFPIGFIAAAVSGYFCIRFLLNYLQKHSMNVFVYYRWALAALVATAGLQVLQCGGNAADAAIATAAALNVTEPTSTGLGGDAFALYYEGKTRQVYALNGSGRAPRALTLERLPQEGLGLSLIHI